VSWQKIKSLGDMGVPPASILKVNLGHVFFFLFFKKHYLHCVNCRSASFCALYYFVFYCILADYLGIILSERSGSLKWFWLWFYYETVSLRKSFFFYKHLCLRNSFDPFPGAEGLAAMLCHTSWSFIFNYAFDIKAISYTRWLLVPLNTHITNPESSCCHLI